MYFPLYLSPFTYSPTDVFIYQKHAYQRTDIAVKWREYCCIVLGLPLEELKAGQLSPPGLLVEVGVHRPVLWVNHVVRTRHPFVSDGEDDSTGWPGMNTISFWMVLCGSIRSGFILAPLLLTNQSVATTLQSVMNAKLSKHRFWHCHENGLIKTIQTIPNNL